MIKFLQTDEDLTGTTVTSDRPVAVYSGDVCANIKGKSCDHLAEQLSPVHALGQSFVIVPYSVNETRGSLVQITGKGLYSDSL